MTYVKSDLALNAKSETHIYHLESRDIDGGDGEVKSMNRKSIKRQKRDTCN